VGGGSTQGQWRIISGSGTFGSSGTSPGSALPAANTDETYIPSAGDFTAGNVQLQFVALDPDGPTGPCADVPNSALRITFDRNPGASNAGPDFDICSGNVANLSAVAPSFAGTGQWSSVPVTSVVSNSNPTTSTSSGLTTTTTFTWTVKSKEGSVPVPPAGACPATTDDVVVTVLPRPAINNVLTEVCQTNYSMPISADNVDLSSYNDEVTGIPGSVDREVHYYTDAAQLSEVMAPYLVSVTLSNNKFYTRVIDTSNPNLCESRNELTFTITSKPPVTNKTFSFCEDAPVGSGVVSDIDLTTPSVGNDITALTPANRDIFWYDNIPDAENDVVANRIATPNDIDLVTPTRTVYARVVDKTTGCFNIAEVVLTIGGLPADPVILGKVDPCKDGAELYRVSQVAGAQYIWTYPAGVQYLGGGGVNDFYILLSFPNANVTGDISVKLRINGCESNVTTRTITVSDDPQGYSIVPPATNICENGIYQYTVSPNNEPSSTYNWQVVKQSDGSPGGVVADGQTKGTVLIQFLSDDAIVRVSESNASGCAGPAATLPVTVNKRPIMANLTTDICSFDSTNVILTTPKVPVKAAVFNVQVPAIAPGIIPMTTPTQGLVDSLGIRGDRYRNQTIAPVLSLIYRVTPISAEGCEGVEKNVTVNIKAEPTLDPNLSTSICSDVALGTVLKSAIGTLPADKFLIESITPEAGLTALTPLPPLGVLLNNNAIENDVWQNTNSTDLRVTYLIRPYSSVTGCFGNPAVPVTITIQRKPLMDAVTPLTICSGDVLNIPLTSSNVSNATFSWTVKQISGNITGATGSTTSTINDRLINNNLTLGRVTYAVHAIDPTSFPVCSGPDIDVIVDVRQSPDITAVNRQFCSDAFGGTKRVVNLLDFNTDISTESPVTYTWFTDENDFANSQIPSGTAPGQVSAYEVTDDVPVFVRVLNTAATSGCFKDTKLTIDVRPTPELTIDPVETTDPRFNISCFGGQDGQVAVSAQYGTNHTFSVDGGSFVPSILFSSLNAGLHTFQTRNSQGCIDTKTVTLVQPDAIALQPEVVTNVSCFNSTAPDGSIMIQATGGTSMTTAGGPGDPLVLTLLQDPASVYNNTTHLFSNLRANTYTVKVEDKNGCFLFKPNIVVGQPTDITPSISITSDYNGFDVSCAGAEDGQVTITASGGTPGYTFELTGFPNKQSGNVDGVYDTLKSNTLYTVTVTDAKGCKKLSLPVFLIDPSPLVPGVVGFDEDICEGADPIAFKELAPAFGGINTYTYRWEQSDDNASWAPAAGVNTNALYDPPALVDTTFYRRIVTSGSCSEQISNTTKIVVHPLPVASLTAPDKVCEGAFFTLDFEFLKGQAPYYFQYTDGTTTFNLVGGEDRPVPVSNYSKTTTYTLQSVKDFYGCQAVVGVPVSVTPQMINMNTNFTVSPATASCSGGLYTFTWTVNPDVEYTWTWNDGTAPQVIAPVPGPAAPTVQQITHAFTSANVGGNTVIPVTLTSRSTLLAACEKQSPGQNITIYPNIFLNLTSDKNRICGGEPVTFINTTLGGTTHTWFYRRQGVNEEIDKQTFAAATTRTLTLVNTSTSNPIVYEVVYRVANANCSDEIVIPITVYRGMTAAFNAVQDPITLVGGEATAEFVNTSTPNSPDFSFAWTFGTGAKTPTSNKYDPDPVIYESIGQKDVRLVVTNEVAKTDGLTCFKEITVPLQVLLPPLVADFSYTPQTFCFPSNITITQNRATGDLFEWTLKDKGGRVLYISTEKTPTFLITAPGKYTIFLKTTNSITGQEAYADNSAKPIEILDNPFAAFEVVPDTIVFVPDDKGVEMRNNSLRATSFYWDFDDGTIATEYQPNHKYQQEGNYEILLIASNNYGNKDIDGDGVLDGDLVCYDSATQVVIGKSGGRVKIPNAFTPNQGGPNGGRDDGLFNDVFRPLMEGVEEFEMQIFDRWGNLIFESKDKSQGWDGYDKNGRLMPAGVYVYKLTIRLSDSQRSTQVGDVTLIR
jgi:gliding motility-associated-like protein